MLHEIIKRHMFRMLITLHGKRVSNKPIPIWLHQLTTRKLATFSLFQNLFLIDEEQRKDPYIWGGTYLISAILQSDFCISIKQSFKHKSDWVCSALALRPILILTLIFCFMNSLFILFCSQSIKIGAFYYLTDLY